MRYASPADSPSALLASVSDARLAACELWLGVSDWKYRGGRSRRQIQHVVTSMETTHSIQLTATDIYLCGAECQEKSERRASTCNHRTCLHRHIRRIQNIALCRKLGRVECATHRRVDISVPQRRPTASRAPMGGAGLSAIHPPFIVNHQFIQAPVPSAKPAMVSQTISYQIASQSVYMEVRSAHSAMQPKTSKDRGGALCVDSSVRNTSAAATWSAKWPEWSGSSPTSSESRGLVAASTRAMTCGLRRGWRSDD